MKPTEKDYEEVYRGVPLRTLTEAEVDDLAWKFSERPIILPSASPRDIQHELSQLEPKGFRGRPHEA